MIIADFSGQTLGGRYRLVARIGHGGMATVYEAVDTQIDKPVAVKVLHPQFAVADDYMARFRQEAFAAAKIRHPNLVDVTDFGIDEGRAYLVMELLEGESLSARIEREPGAMRWAEAVTIMTQVCDAVAHTHDHGLIHRDIKPGNIFLVTQPGRPGVAMAKLLDLGIAKVLRDASSMRPMAPETRLTQGTPGTPEYMSPEQALGLEIDHRIDIYAIGVTLYRMLTGFLPFQSQNSVYEVQRKHIELPPPPLFVLAPEARIPPSIQEIVLRALAKRPDERQASAWELGEELFVAHEAETGRASRSPSAREEQTMRHFQRKDEAGPGGVQRLLAACMALGGLLIAGTVFMVLSLFELPFVKDVAGVRGHGPSGDKSPPEIEAPDVPRGEAPGERHEVVAAPVEDKAIVPEPPVPEIVEAEDRASAVNDRPAEAPAPTDEPETNDATAAPMKDTDTQSVNDTTREEPKPPVGAGGPKSGSEGKGVKGPRPPKPPMGEPPVPKPGGTPGKDPRAQAEAQVKSALAKIVPNCRQARSQQIRLMIKVDYATGKVEGRETGLDTRGGKCVCEALKHVRLKPLGTGTTEFPLGSVV